MKNKIRIMQITHDLQIGGLQQVVVNICRTIDREKFEVVVLCLRELGELVTDIEKLGIKVILLEQENRTDYLSFLKVVKIFKDEKIDVIHTHNTQPFIDGTLAALLSKVKTIVHTDHARKFPDKRRYMFAEWLVSHLAYKVVGVSVHTTENLRKYEKISKKKLTTIVNGIDESVYEISIDQRQKKIEIGIEEDSYVLGLGVRLVEQKGVSCLINAMMRIRKKVPNVILIIAGDGEYKPELEKLVAELGLDAHVKFLGPRKDIPELLKIMDLYVLPSYSEGLPMVILEAMASGCPIVSTDVGGISTAIEHDVNGLLVRPGSAEELTEAVVTLLDDQEKRNTFSKNGKRIFEERFSAKKMIKEYQKLYLEGYSKSRAEV